MSNVPLMPMATAVWLVENTTLTFKQISKFCNLHEVEVQGIADGAPVDDSTLSTNTSDYLENNLKQTVKWIEKNSSVELLAIGIGHDVTRYYSKAIKIADVQDLGDVMINQLTDLFSENKKKKNTLGCIFFSI